MGTLFWLLSACMCPVAIRGEEPTREPFAEFASLEELRTIEAQVQRTAERVRPAIVALGEADNDAIVGSGVVFDKSGLILTHAHHDRNEQGSRFTVRFPDGRKTEAALEAAHTGDPHFSLLKITEQGEYPFVSLHGGPPPAAGARCVHLGYPNAIPRESTTEPLLRYGRVAAVGQFTIYASCMIMHGDSGGGLFDLEGRLLGIAATTIGPALAHPGCWTSIDVIRRGGDVFLQPHDPQEAVRLKLTNGRRHAPDAYKSLPNTLLDGPAEAARRCTVEVLRAGRRLILGTIVDSDGLVVTKRSELQTPDGVVPARNDLACRLHDGTLAPAEVIASSDAQDVLLLRIAAKNLTSAPWSKRALVQGTMALAPVPGSPVTQLGVLSAASPFALPAETGLFLVDVKQASQGVAVTSSDKQLARNVDGALRQHDVITHVRGVATPDVDTFRRMAGSESFCAGDLLQVKLLRDGVPKTVYFHLRARAPITFMKASRRRTGFAAVVSHDVIVDGPDCGGPLIDADGLVLGINIARIQRSCTLTIPAAQVQRLVDELRPK